MKIYFVKQIRCFIIPRIFFFGRNGFYLSIRFLYIGLFFNQITK